MTTIPTATMPTVTEVAAAHQNGRPLPVSISGRPSGSRRTIVIGVKRAT